jgi:hypothetical protein
MKNISSFSEFLNEDIGSTPQQRFDTAIYLTYVQHRQQNQFKHVSKEEFYAKLQDKTDKIDIKKYDMKDIHRIADEKHIWLSKSGRTLGEVYKESDDGQFVRGDCESYWINTEKY